MINSFFDAIFCINLLRRPDRKAQAEAEFARHNIHVQWIPGVDGRELDLPHMISSDGLRISNGDIGCCLSHAIAANVAKDNKLDNYLIFEDDIQCIDNLNEVFPAYMEHVPTDWEILYLGHSINGTKHFIHNNVVRATNIFTTHAVAFKHTVYDSLIEIWEKRNEKVDIALATLQTKFNTYAFEPFLVGQRASWSDIQEKDTYYEHLDVNKS